MGFLQSIRRKLAIGFKISYILGRISPINSKKIIFDNFCGKGYGDDPKYICEELRKLRRDLDLVWIVDPKKNIGGAGLPDGIRTVNYGTRQAVYEMLTAHIWVDNVKNNLKPPKRKGQFYLQTWHSVLGLKKNEKMAEQILEPEYVEMSKKDASVTDLMYSNNDVRLNLYKNNFWYSGPVIKCSVPRCKIFFDPEIKKTARRKVCDYFSLPSDANIILYVPTFRHYGKWGDVGLDYGKCLEIFSQKCCKGQTKGPWVFLWRAHPNVSVADNEDTKNGIYNASHYDDVYELIEASTAVISDYSNCVFDAALAGKPAFMYAPDIDDYSKNDRSLYFEPEELPFPISTSQDMLNRHIEEFSCEEYKLRVDSFFAGIGLEEDGKGAERISAILLEKIEKREQKYGKQ